MKIETFNKLAPHAHDGWGAAFIAEMPKWSITGTARESAFLGQLMVECDGFTRFEENLWYHAARLCVVFPHEFPNAKEALAYNMRPIAIANRVYANRLGNGNEASGDGYRFRGMGPIEITGKDNYAEAEKGTGIPFLAHPEAMLQPAYGARAACWFFAARNCNALADEFDVKAITHEVNGPALLALGTRIHWTDAARKLIEAEVE